MSLRKKYVAIAWTRPIPRLGFHSLPQDIDEAAKKSRTIRYQRDLIRKFVRKENGELEREIALMEEAPDRASPDTVEALKTLVRKCSKNATFVSVDFQVKQGWRPQPALRKGLPDDRCLAVYPAPIELDGIMFNPIEHFQKWRDEEKKHIGSKFEHHQTIVKALIGQGEVSFTKQAGFLNERGLKTHGGKVWTADNLRKFLSVKM